jgi:hydrogenase expression/formation protein HypC
MCLGIPGLILQITDATKKLGVVDVGGVTRTVNLACIVNEEHPIESCVGEWVLVHVGFAMQRVDEIEAERTLELLRELGEIHAQQQGLS